MVEDTCSSSLMKLLQPELMSVDELIACLQERCIVVDKSSDKSDLVELAYRFLTPLPQRTYRPNRRGTVMTQSQKCRLEELKKMGITPVVHSGVTYHVGKSLSATRAESGSAVTDRLKPPPSAINYDNKKIKLSSSSGSTSHVHVSPPAIASRETKTVPVTTDSTSSVCSVSPKKIKLTSTLSEKSKASASVNSLSNSAIKRNCVTDGEPEAKRFKPIAPIKWP